MGFPVRVAILAHGGKYFTVRIQDGEEGSKKAKGVS